MIESKVCVCAPLKIGTILLAICEFVVSIIGLVASTGVLIYFDRNQEWILTMFASPPENLECLQKFINLDNLGSTSIQIFLILSAIYWLQRSGLSILLLCAVFTEHRIHCQVWVVYSIILLTLSCVGFLAAILTGLLGYMSIPVYVGLFCIREYSMCVVSNFEKTCGNSTYKKTLSDW